MKAEPKKVGIKNPEHGEFIERRCAELNVRVEGVLNTNTKLQEYVDARAIIFVEMMEQFNLTQSAMIIIWDVSRFTAVNWQKRYAKLKASPRAVVKTKTPSESPEQALAVLFADHPKVLEQIKTLAQYEMRTLGDQVIYMAKSYIESTLEMMLKVKAVLEEK